MPEASDLRNWAATRPSAMRTPAKLARSACRAWYCRSKNPPTIGHRYPERSRRLSLAKWSVLRAGDLPTGSLMRQE